MFRHYEPSSLARSASDDNGQGSSPPTEGRRRRPIACHRCRGKRKKCVPGTTANVCSNCERARVRCQGGGDSELRVRFSQLTHLLSHPAAKATDRREGCRTSSRHSHTSGHVQTSSASLAELPPSPPSLSTEERITLEKDWVAFKRYWGVYNRSRSTEPWLWPLGDHEARLVRYFLRFLAPWFDYCQDGIPFQKFIQSVIYRNACILYGVLAVTSCYLEALGTGSHRSDEYEQKCFDLLIPTIGEAGQVLDDAVLVSALLLRVFDEMTDAGESSQGVYKVSAALLLRMRESDASPSALSNAAMVMALRQEIFVANMTRRPAELRGQDCGISRDCTVDSAISDSGWTLRIISHAADVTDYAHGPSHQRTEARWDALWLYLTAWELARPATFRALNGNRSCPGTSLRNHSITGLPDNADGIFPAIYHGDSTRAAAHQYLELCRLLLLAYDPRAPVVGLGRRDFVQSREEEMRNAARVICGVCVSNLTSNRGDEMDASDVALRSVATLAIALTGDLFGGGGAEDPRQLPEEEKRQISAMLEIVGDFEKHMGWPCLKVGTKLEESWGIGDRRL